MDSLDNTNMVAEVQEASLVDFNEPDQDECKGLQFYNTIKDTLLLNQLKTLHTYFSITE